jgi:glycosyltransferase involved in cell wall biosynthesis
MRFGINAQRLAGQPFGVGRYLEYLLKYWAKMLTDDEKLNIYIRQSLDENNSKPPTNAAMTIKQLTPQLTPLLWEHLILPQCSQELDVLFGPSYTIPIAYRSPCVVAIHSVNEIVSNSHPWWYDYTYRQLYTWSGHRANRAIVPCETTKIDVEKHYRIPANKIDIIPQGADDSFRPIEDESLLKATRERWLGSDVPFVLFVGSLSKRRNTLLLIEAFAKVKKQHDLPHKLLLFGRNHDNLPIKEFCEALEISDCVVQTDGKIADHTEMIPIYNAAEVFVHPSLYEGWSMTTTEALACGTATIASNRGGLGDVANGHALMLEVINVDTLADAIAQVLLDANLKQELRIKARNRGSTLRWEDTSRQTLDVLRKVAGG